MNTVKLYYEDPFLKEFDSKVISCTEKKDKKGKCTGWDVLLEKTAFFPEGGGQPFDTGMLQAENEKIIVTDVREHDGCILHTTDKFVKEGTEVHGIIDWDRRFDHTQQHSGEHIVSGMICSRFNCNNIGFHMGSDVVTIDYDREITWEQLQEIEREANDFIWSDKKVKIEFLSGEALQKKEYRSKKHIEGDVRIVEFEGADICACCGTHVISAGQVGLVKLLSVQKYKGGVRIEVLSGERAYEYLRKIYDNNRSISQMLSVKPHETYDGVSRVNEELFKLKGKLMEISENLISGYECKYRDTGDVMIVENCQDANVIRKMATRVSEASRGLCLVFSKTDNGYSYAIAGYRGDVKEYCARINKALNGKGGGSKGFATGFVNADIETITDFWRSENSVLIL